MKHSQLNEDECNEQQCQMAIQIFLMNTNDDEGLSHENPINPILPNKESCSTQIKNE